MIDKDKEIRDLVYNIKSSSTDLRNKSIIRLRETGWLFDFSLKEVDLNGADLSGANLMEARLEWANLSNANLEGADLTRAWLYNANLRKANLSNCEMRAVRLGFTDMQQSILIGADAGKGDFTNADLSNADCYGIALWSANLSDTNFFSADLRHANLRGAVLRHTKVNSTRFDEVSIGGTIIASVDLSKTLGLNTIEHWRPSHIDIDTLFQSRGNIPREFLRGCGVPDTVVTYTKSLVNSASSIDFFKVFISFSSEDRKFVDRLFNALSERNVICWKYDNEQHLGQDLYDNIDVGFRASEKVIFVSSKSSWQSSYVLEEVKHAFELQQTLDEVVLIPVNIDNHLEESKDFFKGIIRRKIYANFQGWENNESIFEEGIDLIMQALKK